MKNNLNFLKTYSLRLEGEAQAFILSSYAHHETPGWLSAGTACKIMEACRRGPKIKKMIHGHAMLTMHLKKFLKWWKGYYRGVDIPWPDTYLRIFIILKVYSTYSIHGVWWVALHAMRLSDDPDQKSDEGCLCAYAVGWKLRIRIILTRGRKIKLRGVVAKFSLPKKEIPGLTAAKFN